MKVAVVTGAGSGIGREVSILLAQKGYEVWLLGRREDALLETSSLCGGLTKILPIDVSSRAEVYAQLENLKVDVLVCSAGICERSGLFDEGADAVWEKTMATNLDGVWYPFRALARGFQKNGRAVVVSSGLGKLGREGHGAYVASKHAVLGLVKCFSRDLAHLGVTVNAVCPGWVDTEMSRQNIIDTANARGVSPEEIRKDAENNIALKRFVSTKECAELILFLCSEAAAAITGESYNISGGEFFA